MSNGWWGRFKGAAGRDPFAEQKRALEKTRAYAERAPSGGDRALFKRLATSVLNLPEPASPRDWEPVGGLLSASAHWGWLREWGRERGAEALERTGADERSLFLLACEQGAEEGAWARRAALEMGAREALSAPYKKTELSSFFEKAHPLEIAMERGSSEMLRELSRAGASWDQCKIKPEALAQRAKAAGVLEPLAWLKEKGARLSDTGAVPLLDLSGWPGDEAGAMACARSLLALGADPSREAINPREYGGASPLASAIRRGFESVAEMLMGAGANPETEEVAAAARESGPPPSAAALSVERVLSARALWREKKDGPAGAGAARSAPSPD